MTWTCDLWPQAAPPASSSTSGPTIPLEFVFPSARQAIAQTLADAGLQSESRVGYPPFLSPHVPRAISRTATAVCVAALTDQQFACLDALLVHEQWGWPLPDAVLTHLFERFANRLLVVDRVDSADFFYRPMVRPRVVEIVSLAKTLGLLGGGLARRASTFKCFDSATMTAKTRVALDRLQSGGPEEPYREFFKNSAQAMHPAVARWVVANSPFAALEDERTQRQHHVRLVENSALADGWPQWMHDAVAAGAGPGMTPVLRGRGPDVWNTAMRVLAQNAGVASTVGMFNWTGDPLEPDFEPCLLVPVHRDMQHLVEVMRALASLSAPGP
jgi:hypothetical protein